MKQVPEILFEDDQLIIINKPSGILTIPDRHDAAVPSVGGYLKKLYGKVWVVHRLDKETSGILCFAKNEVSHRHLSMQFEHRQVEKAYWALIEGRPMDDDGTITRPIAPHPRLPGRMITSAKGKPSTTHYKVLERFKAFSLIEAKIETGRTHQVRVHMKSVGYPLVADAMYGSREALFLNDIKLKGVSIAKNEEPRPLLSRTALHAWKLVIQHPSTEEKITYEAPLPKDLNAVLNQLKKWGS